MKRYVVQREISPSSRAFIEDNTEVLGEFDELEPAKALLLVMCEGWHTLPDGTSGVVLMSDLTGPRGTGLSCWARVVETSDLQQPKADT